MGTGSVQFRPGVKMKCIHSFLTAENWESCILAFTKSFFSSAYNLFSGQELDKVSEDVAIMIICVYILSSLIHAINHTRTWLPLISHIYFWYSNALCAKNPLRINCFLWINGYLCTGTMEKTGQYVAYCKYHTKM